MKSSLNSSDGYQAEETSSKPKLYILSDFHPKAVKYAESLFDCVHHNDPEAQNWRSNATAILIKDYHITEKDLEVAPQLCVIGKQGVGLDKIDIEACQRRNVKVCNPSYIHTSAVAEMTVCLALSVARRVPEIVLQQRVHGEAVGKEMESGLLLSGRTIGIVGMGEVGRAVATMFQRGFSASIVTYDPVLKQDGDWYSMRYDYARDLEDLLHVADVVAVHVPLTSATRNMISMPQLKKMKKSAILLNTGCGGIINEDDLAQALDEGLIWGAGFDCHLESSQRLWSCPRFVGTPHIAAVTEEAQVAAIDATTDEVYGFLLLTPLERQRSQSVWMNLGFVYSGKG